MRRRSRAPAPELKEFIDRPTRALGSDDDRDVQPTLGFQRVLQRAVFHVQSSGRKEVTRQRARRDLQREAIASGVSAGLQDVTRLDVVNYMSHGVPKIAGRARSPRARTAPPPKASATAKAAPLERFTTNLNALAEAGKIDPLIGRQLEIERTVADPVPAPQEQPLYVGEAGVGKTALAEGLARLIVEGKVPDVLRGLHDLRARHGLADRRHEVSRRFREAAEGRASQSSRSSPARSCSSTRSTPSSAPAPPRAA